MTISRHRFSTYALFLMLVAIAACGDCRPATAQSNCSPAGYRVTARRWDAVLGTVWELRQNCAHPEWPAHAVALAGASPLPPPGIALRFVETLQPLQIHAGDQVKLWLQDATVRIEMRGVAEQSGRDGDHIIIRIIRQTDDDGMTIERITGIVRGAGDVEMEP